MDANGSPASRLALGLLDRLDEFVPATLIPLVVSPADRGSAHSREVNNTGSGASRDAALDALAAWLAGVGPVRLIVLDDLDVRDSPYLDTGSAGFDGDRVMRSLDVDGGTLPSTVANFVNRASSFRMIGACVRISNPVRLSLGHQLVDWERESLLSDISHVIVSAFDGEGFAIAARRPG